MVVRRAGVPIVPAAIDGSFAAWPRGRKLPRFHPIHVLFGPPLNIKGLSDEQITALIDRALRDLFEQLKAMRRDRARGN
jgi:1-acyl-sn-glycerol-3-phosphate acyltransferase